MLTAAVLALALQGAQDSPLSSAEALRAARDRGLKPVEAHLEALRERKIELNRRRDAALRAVADPKVYLPEAHADFKKGDEANGQKAVDALVAAVQELWEAKPVPVDPAWRAQAKAVVEATAGAGDPDPALMHNLAQETLDLRSFALDAKEVDLWTWNRRVDRYNEGLADADLGAVEKQGAAVINGYREMMGRRRLFLDARLCRSSKSHGAACNAAQKIWHAGADGDPQTRARLEAFPNPVAENVAISFADGLDVWKRGWFRASDHHRNGISEAWNCLGYAYVGNVGVQTFSNIPPPKALLIK